MKLVRFTLPFSILLLMTASLAAQQIRAVRIGEDFGATTENKGEETSDVEAQPVPEKTTGVVSLINGNTIAGEIGVSTSEKSITWHGDAFVEPMQVLTDAIKSIKFPPARQRMTQQGQFAFELVSGDLMSGDLVAWDDTTLTFQSEQFGKVKVKAASLRRMYRLEENPTLVFASLAGIQDWSTTNWDPVGWQEDGAQIWSDKDDATINGDLDVPDRAMIEIELSWVGKPNFMVAIAADHDSDEDKRTDGWRLETFGQTLAVMREYERAADVEKVDSLADKTGIRLLVYLDQSAGKIMIYRPDGTKLAELAPPKEDVGKRELGRGIRLINRHGTVRLERLRISRWSGNLPKATSGGNIAVARVDGAITSGDAVRLDVDAGNLIVTSEAEEVPIAIGDVVAVKVTHEPNETSELPMSLFLHDGTRISGRVQRVTEKHWVMRSDEVEGEISVPAEMARTLIVMQREPVGADAEATGRAGRLELGPHKLSGRLVTAIEDADKGMSTFRWQGFGCVGASTLKHEADGRIVYRDPPPKPSPSSAAAAERALQMQRLRVQQQKRGLNFGKLFLQKVDSKSAATPVGPDAHRLHVRSGDVIPCLVQAIDEQGVHLSTSWADNTVVPHHKVKAIEWVVNVSPPSLKEAKKERLLTLPRLQKPSPPTHLLCSRNGDFLRCRLLNYRDDSIRVEVQLDEYDIPLSRISQIIWFHPEDLLKQQKAAQENKEPETESPFLHMAQVLKRDGKRVTFDPESVDGDAITGRSDVVGFCNFDLRDVDQILFGEGIGQAVSSLPYNKWVLHSAVEPKMASASAGGEAPPVGSESTLIGQEAPEIKLDMLDGDRFVLSEQKGKIVVLDFWATWCAPCMQTMPLVEEAIAEFDPAMVRLVSVNLEEPADHVKAVMERHEMEVPVALDLDGVAAHRYEARAIPQMVIVGPDGKIARLYVGGGPKMVAEMKKAITELLENGSGS